MRSSRQPRLENPLTPDGRYMVVRGRLWRVANPQLTPAAHDALVNELMAAKREVKAAQGPGALISFHFFGSKTFRFRTTTLAPDNPFKPELHRYASNKAERACHVARYALQFGLA